MAGPIDEDSFDIAVTAADQAALLRHISRQPYRLVIQASTFLLLWLAFVAMQLAIGLIGAFFATRGGLREAGWAYLTTGFIDDLRTTAPVFTGFVLFLVVLSNFVLIPRQCRALGAKIMAAYPTPPGGGAWTSRLRLGEKGIESTSDHERLFLAWAFVQGLVETKRHLFLMVGRASGFAIAKAALDATAVDRFRALVARRLEKAAQK